MLAGRVFESNSRRNRKRLSAAKRVAAAKEMGKNQPACGNGRRQSPHCRSRLLRLRHRAAMLIAPAEFLAAPELRRFASLHSLVKSAARLDADPRPQITRAALLT